MFDNQHDPQSLPAWIIVAIISLAIVAAACSIGGR